MIKNNKDFIVIIPARGGSKRIKNKNMIEILGNPLIYYSINFALKNFPKENIWVNSDDKKILDYSKTHNVNTYKRKAKLATDIATTEDAIKDQVIYLKDKNIKFDYVITLQPTSPLRPDNLIYEAIKFYKNNPKNESLICVSDFNTKYGKVKNNLFSRINYNKNTRSQDINNHYYENGLIYISKVNKAKDFELIEDNPLAFKYNGIESSIDIDNPNDFKLAKLIIENRNEF